MALRRIWPSIIGPALTVDPNPYSLSVEFMVTQAGCTFTGFWFWLPAGADTSALTFSLWSCTTGTTGTQIGSNALSPSLSTGQWNFTPYASPVALVPGQHYRAIVTHSQSTSWYGGIGGYWTAGGAGAGDLANGPLVAFTAANALGGIQGGFVPGGSAAYTTTQNVTTNYGIDVQIDDGGGGGSSTVYLTPPGRLSPMSWALPAVSRPPSAAPVAGGLYLVGAPGIGTRSTSSPVTGTYSQPPKAGNLLVAVINFGSVTAAVPVVAQNAGTSGWVQLVTQGNAGSGSGNAGTSVWTKIAAGSDAAPAFTFSGSGGGAGQCTIFELFNPAGTPVDVSAVSGTGAGSSSVTSAAISIGTGSAIAGTGEFVIRGYASSINGVAATNTWTAGAVFRNAYNDGAGSSTVHMAVDWAQNPTPAVVTSAPSVTTFTGWAASVIVAFRPAPAPAYPPGVISAVGQLVSNNAASLTALAVTPQNAGDVLVVGTKLTSATITLSSISAPGTTGWTRVAGPFADNQGTVRTQEIWIGTVTAPGATTLTFTWSSSNSGLTTDLDCMEFTTGIPGTAWARDGTQQASQNNAASATVSWASLTAAASGELWAGTSRVGGGGPYTTSAAGLVCCLDLNSNAFAYNTAVPAGAYAPTVTDLAGSIASSTLGVLIVPSFGMTAPPPMVAGTALIDVPAVQAGSGITTAVVAASASFGVPVIRADTVASPAVLAAAASFGADAIRADQLLTTAVVSCPVTVPASTVNAGSAKTTSVVACTTSIPVPSITAQTSATVTPAVVSCPASVAATASAGSGVTPAAVAASASFGAPSVIVPAAMLTDDFGGSSVDSTKWATFGSAPVEGGGVLSCAVSTGVSCGVTSVARYSLTGSAAYVQIPAAGIQQAAVRVAFELGLLKWGISNGSFFAQWDTTTLFTTTYLPGTHQWCRIRESGGTVFFDYSTNGTTWNNVTSVLVSTLAGGGINIDNLQVRLAGIVGGSVSSTTITFDAYNAAAAGATATPAVVAATASVGTQAIRADQIVTTTVAAATAAVPGPVVNAGSQVTPAVVAVPVTVPVPSLHTAEVVTTAVVAAAASVGAPALRTDTILTTAVVACAATIPVPSLRDDEGLTTAVVPCTATIPVPSVRADQVVITAVVACTTTVPAPVTRAGSGVTTAVVACVTSIAVAVSVGETVTTAVVACTATIPAPSVTAGGNATAVPTVVGCAATIPSPALRADQIASPAVVPASATAAATASAGSTVTAGPVAVIASVPVPSVQSGTNAIVTPAVVSCPAAIGAAASAGSTAAPGVVAALASFGAPVIATATVAIPPVVSVPVTIPGPSLRCDERVITAVVPGVVAITAPGIQAVSSATAAPPVVSATTTISTPAAAGGAGASPATLLASALIGTPAVTTGSRIVPPPVACTTAIPVPLIATVATIFLNVVSCRAQIFVPYVTTSRSGGTATTANTTGPEVALARTASSVSLESGAPGAHLSRSAAGVTVQNRPGAGRVVPGRKP